MPPRRISPSRARTVALAAALACLFLLPALASAHPALKQAAPSPGLVTPGPADAIDLSFSEPIVPAGSRIVLRRLGGEKLAVGPLRAGRGALTLSADTARPIGAGLYKIEWTALGADGHTVSGEFAFGLSDRDGTAPAGAQERLALGSRGGPGEQRAVAEGPLAVTARWIGLLAASILLGGWALLALASARRALAPDALAAARRRWSRLAPVAWVAALTSATVAVLLSATAGAGGGLHPDLLLRSPTGRGAAAVLLVLALGTIALVVLRRRPPATWVLAGGGLVVLVGEALTGHVQTLTGGDRFLAGVLQAAHALSAGLWLGGLLVLAALSIRPGAGADSPLGPLARAFAPLAATALGVAAITGVLAAFREVEHGYFLRWSAYGNLVLVKGALVLLAGGAGLYAFLRTRRHGTPARGPLRAETGIVAVVLALAAVLAGLVPGRGQALPAQRGTLAPGPALASAIADGGPLRVTLAPARSGANVLTLLQESALGLPPAAAPRWAEARLFCACAEGELAVDLKPGPGGTLSGPVELPSDGPWYAKLIVEGRETAPVALPTGVPSARGSSPVTVLTVGDLSGRGARRCRAHLLGLELGIARLNALGGVDGGRKIALVGLDDGGAPALGRRRTAGAIAADDPIGLVAPCGPAAGAAVAEAAEAGLPSIVADPAVPQVAGDRIFRLAADPYAEGFATGDFIRTTVVPSAASRIVRAVATGTPDGERRIAGLRAGLARTRLRVEVVPEARLPSDPDGLRALIDRTSAAAVLLDGDPADLAARLAALGRGELGFAPAPVLAASPVLSERFVSDSGGIGRIGAVQGAVEVMADSATAAAYARALPRVFPGEQPALDGLRGYVAGLALAEGLKGGTGRADLAAALVAPAPFTDAIVTPWRDDAPAAGNQRFAVVKGTFLPPTLIPASSGGDTYAGTWFPDGAWSRLTNAPLGPPLDRPVPPLPEADGA
jgi:putative copper export protein/methionine-rich copper-binding protein CopC/ABC-type branched-subunit amino acid transport system substrate-binding protein